MGRKERREREQKRESRAVRHAAEKRKHMMIAIAVLGSVAAIVGWSGYVFVTMDTSQMGGAPFGAGPAQQRTHPHRHTGKDIR